MKEDYQNRCFFSQDGSLVINMPKHHYTLTHLIDYKNLSYEQVQRYKQTCEKAMRVISLDGLPEKLKDDALSFIRTGLAKCIERENQIHKESEQISKEASKRLDFSYKIEVKEEERKTVHTEQTVDGPRYWIIFYDKFTNGLNDDLCKVVAASMRKT